MPKLDGSPGRPADPWSAFDPHCNVIAIDPGDVHVGMAEFEEGHCVQAWEETPAGALFYVAERLVANDFDALVIEEFRLYPWKAQQQAFSQMKTAELIGAFKLLWATNGQMIVTGTVPNTIWYQQGAAIKKPIDKHLKARGVTMLADENKAGGHARDAELHGYHFLSNNPLNRKSNING